jgi:eukaryotic-like serine/threonine-protein kinase
MSTKIGHFEILSELAKSPTGTVYKANDPESGQTIALKVIQLDAFGENAQALTKALLEESEKTKALSSPNITPVFKSGEIDGNFYAAMEYVQGNSIATMLSRKEGFSVWDLLDIGRQLSAALDHAASKNVVHYSLEPSKIMCGWDGTVKILSFGVSAVGNFAHQVNEGLPSSLHYMSPEQVQGQTMDSRSNLFSLGAMLYEMVTERKAFDRDDISSLRQGIVESTPTPPIAVNPKVHPVLSNLIMKAIAKNPAERYQSGRELLDDLEKCKESKSLAAKKAEPAKGTMAAPQAKAAAQSKFIASSGSKPATPTPTKPAPKPAASSPSAVASSEPKSSPAKSEFAIPKAAAAAAANGAGTSVSRPSFEQPAAEIDLSESFSAPEPPAHMSSAVSDEPQMQTFEPAATSSSKISVDPVMAGGSRSASGTSFSEISELPPLKEVYVAPAPPPPAIEQPVQQEPSKPTVFNGATNNVEEKPKVQPREVAEKAIKEIKTVPPKLLFYSLGIAGAIILAIAVGFTFYVHSLNDDDSGAPRNTAATDSAKPAAQPVPAQPATQPVAQAATAAPANAEPTEVEPTPVPASPAAAPKARSTRKKAAPVAPAVVMGQLAIDSNPQGAQVQLDGKTDPSWVTPLALSNIQPGQHTVTISKGGYSTDTRTLDVTGGNRTSTTVRLAQLMATLVVKSDPPGANIFIDGHDVGSKTPAQITVDKGSHVVLVRMMGYIDETMNAQFTLGQTFNFAPTLRSLGNADSIHTVGKMSKLFGGKGVQAGQGTLSIRTQPKGAQIAINQHIVDKNTPADVALDPGNYVIDVTLTGYAPIHKVVTVDKGGKAVIDEVMQKQ